MDLGHRLRMGGSKPRPVTTVLSLKPGRPCQFRDVMDGEKFFSGPFLLCKLDYSRAAELAVDGAMLWEGFDPSATVYAAELGEGTRRAARAELPRESWCQPNERRA